jgi:predicted MFS family arabinose efflux permease
MRSLSKNAALLCAFNALQMSLFPVSIMTLFWKQRIGMSMGQIFWVQAFFGLTMAVFEFPSGYIADRIGYRRTLIAASALGIVGWSCYALADSLPAVILAEAVLGISISLVSGCDAALLYESLRASGREGEFGAWMGRTRFWGQTSEGSSALLAGLLYVAAPALPFVAQAGVAVLSLGLSLLLVEPERHLQRAGSHLRQIQQLVRHALVDNRPLTAVLILTTALGMSSFVPVWLVPLYATGAGVPEAWVGPIWAVANYVVAFASLASTPIAARYGLSNMLTGCVALVALGYAGLSLSHGTFGFAWYFCLTFMRGLFGPALMHLENRLIPSSDRAGFLSFRSLVFRLVFLALGPAVGSGVDAFGMHPVLMVLGLGLSAVGLGALLWFRKQHPVAAVKP